MQFFPAPGQYEVDDLLSDFPVHLLQVLRVLEGELALHHQVVEHLQQRKRSATGHHLGQLLEIQQLLPLLQVAQLDQYFQVVIEHLLVVSLLNKGILTQKERSRGLATMSSSIMISRLPKKD